VNRSFNTSRQEIEATLHRIMSIQEAIPLEDNPFLAQLFGSELQTPFAICVTPTVLRWHLTLEHLPSSMLD